MGDEGEPDLATLYRSYRIAEGDRKSLTEESQGLIRKQRAAIERVKKESDQLREEVAMVNRAANKPASAAVAAQIARLQDTADIYTRKIELEKRKLEEAENATKLLNVKILEQQHERGGVNAVRESDSAVNKQIRVLENRLDKALVKFNDALAYNKSLRETIDNLRRERVVFDEISQKLSKELQDKKKQMANIIEASNVAYEARDEALNQINLLKANADKEQAVFEAELRELTRIIEQDKKLKERMAGQADHRGKLNVDEEAKLKAKINRGNWSMAKDKAAKHASQEKVQSFEEAFAQIRAATGIINIDELVNAFIDAEDQNFSLFNYVNELNNEVEKLEEQIAEIKADIDKYKGQGGQNDRQRKKLLKDLEDRLAATESKAEQYDHKSQKASKTVAALEAGIQSIFTKIGCNTSAISEMLGTTGVTESNIMQYLGVIEQRTNELLQLWKNKNAQQDVPTTTGPLAASGTTNINIEPPVIGDDDDSDEESSEDEERPLSRDELKAKTLRGLNKREGQKMSKNAKKKEAKLGKQR